MLQSNEIMKTQLVMQTMPFQFPLHNLKMGKPKTRSHSQILDQTIATATRTTVSSAVSKIQFYSRKIGKTPTTTKIKATTTTTTISSLTITKPLSQKGEIDIALTHLRNSDPLLATLISRHKPPTFETATSPFLSLTRSILYQQLATNAAKSIYTRFLDLCGGESLVLPNTVLSLSAVKLREIGVSGRKASYLHDLSDKYVNGLLSDSMIVEMDDEKLLSCLTEVKGIGAWSVHMFMLFSLHRPDVLPVGDLGVRKGVMSLYGLKELPKVEEMERVCEKWRPYRSVGSWYMWRLMEAKALANKSPKKTKGVK